MGWLKEFLFWDYDYKFFVLARKIEDEVWRLEEYEEEEDVIEYLEKCAELREEWLDPDNLTDTEEYYTHKIQAKFLRYGVRDPIYDAVFEPGW